MEKNLRSRLIKLAHSKPETRKDLLPILKQGEAKSAFIFGRKIKPREVETALNESGVSWRKINDTKHDSTYDLSGGSSRGGTTIYQDGRKWWYESRYGDDHINSIADVKEQASYYVKRRAASSVPGKGEQLRNALIRLAHDKPEFVFVVVAIWAIVHLVV